MRQEKRATKSIKNRTNERDRLIRRGKIKSEKKLYRWSIKRAFLRWRNILWLPVNVWVSEKNSTERVLFQPHRQYDSGCFFLATIFFFSIISVLFVSFRSIASSLLSTICSSLHSAACLWFVRLLTNDSMGVCETNIWFSCWCVRVRFEHLQLHRLCHLFTWFEYRLCSR